MTKIELRQQYKKKRAALTQAERLYRDSLLLIQFQQIMLPQATRVLLNYWPLVTQFEINTHLISDYLQCRLPALQMAYPVINRGNNHMQLIQTNEETLFKKNAYGIQEPQGGTEVEPESIDIALVPLLLFDEQGHRVGYGKGFYDRLLTNCRADCLTVGLSYFDPIAKIADVDEFDVPLSIVVTPDSLYEF